MTRDDGTRTAERCLLPPERYPRVVRSVDAPTAAAAVAAAFPRQDAAALAATPSADLPARGVLYLSQADLSDDQFDAVSRAAASVGDDEFYLAYADRYVDERRAQDFLLAAHDLPGYRSCVDPAVFDHVLVSPTSKWGVCVLHDGIAVVAGSEGFVSTVYAELPPSIDQAIAFMRDILSMQHRGSEDWVVRLFQDVLGPQTTKIVEEQARATG